MVAVFTHKAVLHLLPGITNVSILLTAPISSNGSTERTGHILYVVN